MTTTGLEGFALFHLVNAPARYVKLFISDNRATIRWLEISVHLCNYQAIT